jgi:hypothetical protein
MLPRRRLYALGSRLYGGTPPGTIMHMLDPLSKIWSRVVCRGEEERKRGGEEERKRGREEERKRGREEERKRGREERKE